MMKTSEFPHCALVMPNLVQPGAQHYTINVVGFLSLAVKRPQGPLSSFGSSLKGTSASPSPIRCEWWTVPPSLCKSTYACSCGRKKSSPRVEECRQGWPKREGRRERGRSAVFSIRKWSENASAWEPNGFIFVKKRNVVVAFKIYHDFKCDSNVRSGYDFIEI